MLSAPFRNLEWLLCWSTLGGPLKIPYNLICKSFLNCIESLQYHWVTLVVLSCPWPCHRARVTVTVIVLVSESWFPVSLEPLQLQLQWRQLELYVPPAKEPIRGQTCLWPPLTMSGGRQLVGCSRRALWEAYPAELEKAPRLIRSLVVWCVSNCVVFRPLSSWGRKFGES